MVDWGKEPKNMVSKSNHKFNLERHIQLMKQQLKLVVRNQLRQLVIELLPYFEKLLEIIGSQWFRVFTRRDIEIFKDDGDVHVDDDQEGDEHENDEVSDSD
jgi:hypothetical protein